jgi:hypothetical protein
MQKGIDPRRIAAMSEEKPSLHIDTDWKKQAQEEKRKLAEQEKQKAAVAAPSPAAGARTAAAPGARDGVAGQRGGRELPAPSFAALVQGVVTQVFFYLGDLTPRGAEPQLNLDMAKYQIDILGVIEEKTKNNLSPEEQHLLDAALYEARMRFVSVSAQIVNG